MVMAVVDGAPAPPALIVERVERRSRLSVAFRLLLVLPQLVVLYVLLLVGVVAVVVGWFAALVLGRLPEPIARYLCHLTRYTTRVYAYLCFLTDRYPPFEFTATDYPVEVDLAPGRLNRLAVLFRLFLVIPASILANLAFGGYLVVSFIIWLVVLFLVLGTLQYVASGVVSVTTTSNARKTTQASADLTAAHNTLAGQGQQYQQQVAACPAELSCVQSADRELADAFAAFATELRRIAFPASAQAEAAELGDLADRIANSLQEQATAGSPEEYQRMAADNQELGNTFDQQEQALVSSLAA